MAATLDASAGLPTAESPAASSEEKLTPTFTGLVHVVPAGGAEEVPVPLTIPPLPPPVTDAGPVAVWPVSPEAAGPRGADPGATVVAADGPAPSIDVAVPGATTPPVVVIRAGRETVVQPARAVAATTTAQRRALLRPCILNSPSCSSD